MIIGSQHHIKLIYLLATSFVKHQALCGIETKQINFFSLSLEAFILACLYSWAHNIGYIAITWLHFGWPWHIRASTEITTSVGATTIICTEPPTWIALKCTTAGILTAWNRMIMTLMSKELITTPKWNVGQTIVAPPSTTLNKKINRNQSIKHFDVWKGQWTI